MLIDLHCHTRNIKSGDGPGREVTDDLFAEKVKASGVEVIAITNHNIFDDTQFLRLEERVKNICRLWPGVELDIGYGEDGKRYHLLVVCNPKNIDSFKQAVAEITDGNTPEDFVGDIQEVIAKFDPLDCLFLPHFLGKTPTIPDDEHESLKSLLSNSSRLIAEASNVRSMGIFVSHGISSIAGSDIKDWNEYPGKDMRLPELRLRIEEFENLCKLLDRDPVIVKTLLDKNKSTPYDVYPKPNDRDIKEQLHFYKEVNVIFGDKGTGKSEVIKCLVNKLKSEETPYSAYISGGTKDHLDELLDTDDMERSADVLGLESCDGAFDTVRSWGDRSLTPLSEYVDYFETRTNKESVQRIGWSRMSDLADDADVRLEQVGEDLENVHSGKNSISEVEVTDYLDANDSESLENLLEKLEVSVIQKEKLTDTEDRAVKLVNFTLSRFRQYTASKTGSATRPQDSGFGKFAKNRLALKNAMCEITLNLAFKEAKKYTTLGDIGDKGKIEIEVRHRMLNDRQDTKSDHKEFGGNITKLREVREKIFKVNSITLATSLDDKLVELKDKLIEHDIKSIDDFVGTYKQTVDKDRMPYTPSTGERSIIFIQRTLNDQEATVFLLDEPEQSMANSYIDDIIRPRIIELGQQKKTVIMATHNANLAVRTLPYATIYRSHDVRGYNTYAGNPFTNQLVNIADTSDVRDWKETSMKILEGGKEAFYDREGIYESGR
jgi:predicted ATPase